MVFPIAQWCPVVFFWGLGPPFESELNHKEAFLFAMATGHLSITWKLQGDPPFCGVLHFEAPKQLDGMGVVTLGFCGLSTPEKLSKTTRPERLSGQTVFLGKFG